MLPHKCVRKPPGLYLNSYFWLDGYNCWNLLYKITLCECYWRERHRVTVVTASSMGAALAVEIAGNGTAMGQQKQTTSGDTLHRPQLPSGEKQYEGESILEQLTLSNHRRNTTCNESLLLTNPFSLHSCFNHILCNPDWNTKSGKICTSTKHLWGSQTAHQSQPFPSLRESIGLFPDTSTRIYMAWLLAAFKLIVAVKVINHVKAPTLLTKTIKGTL